MLNKVIIVVVVLFIIGFFGSLSGNKESDNLENKIEVSVVDFSSMSTSDISIWCDANKIVCDINREYSDTVSKDEFINQNVKTGNTIYEGDKITIVYSRGKEPSNEYKNALAQAETYSEMLSMSKIGVYDQLVSQYGGKFSKDAAQYAIDNVDANWNTNALTSAETYSETLNMSKEAIYDQLISQYGGKFTKTEAQYAIDNMVADWNANALAQAKTYQDTLNMSKNAIYSQLISGYGGKFTKTEAQYAIDNLE